MKLKNLHPLIRIAFLAAILYLFLVSINLMGASFKFMGKDVAGSLFELTTDPFIALFIGILSTSLVQSSSMTTVSIVGMVSAGVLPLENAIPMIMGANIGTTITNIIVAMGYIRRGSEFQRCFAAATVHDFFNLLAVIVIFPLQYYFGILTHMSKGLTGIFLHTGGVKFTSPLKVITAPLLNFLQSATFHTGWLMLAVALILLFLALRYLVVIIKSLVVSKLEKFFDRYIFRNEFLGFLFGIIITSIVQSSSVTTSLVVPLVGAGILNIYQIFTYTMGANIGTTVTAILGALATGEVVGITVAFAHLSFNIIASVVFWPLKFIPIFLAEKLAGYGAKKKYIPIVFTLLVFFVLPLCIIFIVR